MAKLITDLETIACVTQRNDDKNLAFRSFIKGELDWSERKLDELVHEIVRSVTSEIDCTKCANCCRVLGIEVHSEEIKRLSQRLGVSEQEFQGSHVIRTDDGEKVFGERPCFFLRDRKCTVYEDRPRDCRDYPHLHKKGFRTRMLSVLHNAAICPIVFNVLEQLKERLKWR